MNITLRNRRHTKRLVALTFIGACWTFFLLNVMIGQTFSHSPNITDTSQLAQRAVSTPDSTSAAPKLIRTKEDKIRVALRLVDRKLKRDRQILQKTLTESQMSAFWNTENPLRIMLVTSWRSGSTFLGWVLSNHSATFTTYEPLMTYAHQLESKGPIEEEAAQELDSLFRCKYKFKVPPVYGDYITRNSYMFSYNPAIWDSCTALDLMGTVCTSKEFLEKTCRKFPVHVMKLVRLRMSSTEKFLKDPTLPGLKVIHLVRDPRAVMNSRWKLDWCVDPDCKIPSIFCHFMQSDLEAFRELSKTYGDRMMLVKYEDMAMKPVHTIKKIFKFLGLHFTKAIEDIIKERTSGDDPTDPLGTKKIAKERIDSWAKTLSEKNIDYVEHSCRNVMKHLGYSFKNNNSTV